MSMVLERWKTELMTLSNEDRAQLAQFLIHTLDSGSEEDVEAAWEGEITRRVDEIKTGKAAGRPADHVFAELRAKHS